LKQIGSAFSRQFPVQQTDLDGLNMTTQNTWAKAGLVFSEHRELNIVEIANQAVTCLEGIGHRVTGSHILSEDRALVTTRQQELYFSAEHDVSLPALSQPAPAYLAVAVANTDAGDSLFARDSILVRVLQTLYGPLQPDFVKWIDRGVILKGADFARAAGLAPEPRGPGGRIVPRRVRSRKTLPDVDATNETLQERITSKDPAIFEHVSKPDRLRKILAEDWVDPEILAAKAAEEALAREEEDIEKAAPLRLSAWILSFAVALFALPVGIMLMILNLAKGENLRLASQTAALTGTFIALQTFATMAQAMTTIQVMLD